MSKRSSLREWLFRIASRGALHSLVEQTTIVTAALMVAALILMSFALSSLKDARSQSETTEDALLEITTVESRLLDTDRALNGGVLHDDPWFAERIAVSRSEMRIAMDKLGRSVGNDPALVRQYKTIAERLARREKLFDYLVEPAHRSEVANVAASAAARQERAFTNELRDRLWDLLRAQRAKRYAQHTAMINEASKSFWIAAGIVFLAMLSGALSLFLARAATKPNAQKA